MPTPSRKSRLLFSTFFSPLPPPTALKEWFRSVIYRWRCGTETRAARDICVADGDEVYVLSRCVVSFMCARKKAADRDVESSVACVGGEDGTEEVVV